MKALLVTILLAYSLIAFSQTDGAKEGSATYVKGITSARARSLAGVAVGIVSIVIGVRARRRSNRSLSFVSIAMASLAIVLSVIHLSALSGDFGTGGGKAGAIVALVLGLIGGGVGVFALTKTKGSATS